MMNRINYRSLALSLGFLIASQNVFAESKVIVDVNGQPLHQETLDAYAKKRLGVPTTRGIPQDKLTEMIDELVNRELVVQDAERLKLTEDEDVAAQLAEVYKNALLQIRIKRLLDERDPDEETLLTIYKEEIVDKSSEEYHARHILLKTKDDANNVIAELNKGAKFEELAQTHSTGPSRNQGGDLGWFAANQMVKPFADAVVKLKNGKYTTRPVETRFGWHIILRVESRKVEPPEFDTVKVQVLEMAQNQIIAEFIDKLKAKATITLKE